jgi:hypothetical protein
MTERLSSEKVKIITICSFALIFGSSLINTAVISKEDSYSGWVAFFFGLFSGSELAFIAWSGNILCLVSLHYLFFSDYKNATKFAIAALLISIVFTYKCFGEPIITHFDYAFIFILPVNNNLTSLGIGFYLWILSQLVLLIGSIILLVRSKNLPPNDEILITQENDVPKLTIFRIIKIIFSTIGMLFLILFLIQFKFIALVLGMLFILIKLEKIIKIFTKSKNN